MRRLWFRSRETGRAEPMPWRFEPLATYNAERSRGLIHTPLYAERMAQLQAEFNQWREAVRNGVA